MSMASTFVHQATLESHRAGMLEMKKTRGAATQLTAHLASLWEEQEAMWMGRRALTWRAPHSAASLPAEAGAAAAATLEAAAALSLEIAA